MTILMLICHSYSEESGRSVGFQKGESIFTGKWKEEMLVKHGFSTPGRQLSMLERVSL